MVTEPNTQTPSQAAPQQSEAGRQESTSSGSPRPAIAPEEPRHALVFYDGGCGFCHRSVQFVLGRDLAGHFRYAPLFGATFVGRLSEEQRQGVGDSLVVLTTEGRLLTRSSGAIYLLKHLREPWPLVAALLGIVPRPLRNWGYDCIASIRRRLLAAPADHCPTVRPEQLQRFLD